MMYMLDTNILIYLIKNKPPSIASFINALDKDAVLRMSFITYAELLKGAERSTRKEQVLRQLKQLTQVISVLYEANPGLCEHYAIQFTQLKQAGTPIGANDLWIACHALSQNATLVTHNIREFERIAGLRLEDWALAAY
jgi:tRNA(fMet)-specific endonuclease VapC